MLTATLHRVATFAALVATLPAIVGATACSTAASDSDLVAEIEYTREGTPVVEGLNRAEIAALTAPGARADGIALDDPAAALTASRIELDRDGNTVVVIRDGASLRRLESGGAAATSVAWSPRGTDQWVMTYEGETTDSRGELTITASDPAVANRLIGATALGLLGGMDHPEIDEQQHFWIIVIVLAVTAGIGFYECMRGVCAEQCASTCANSDGYTARWTCAPFYSSCDCECWRREQQPAPPGGEGGVVAVPIMPAP